MRTAQYKSDVFYRLNDLPISQGERECMNAYIQEGEHIADLCSRALTRIGSGITLGAHGLHNLAHAVKSVFAKPARR